MLQLGVLGPYSVWIVTVTVLFFFFLLYLLTRYRKFKTNEFVIFLRNGKVKRAGLGGRLFLLPLIDEVIVIPTTIQQTSLEAKEKVVSREYQNIGVTGFVFWQVTEPSAAFTSVSWDKRSGDYVETVIKNAAESIIRTTCANMALEDIIRERSKIIDAVISELHDLMANWGVTAHSVEIRDVEVLDPELKGNMEAVKKAAEEQKAKLRQAEMREITRMRDLDVLEKTGVAEQEIQLEIQSKAKQREVKVQELERQRIEVEATAEKNRLQLIAEGDAAKIKQDLVAEAEGVLQQIMALKESDERLFQLKLIEAIPGIFQKLPIEKMYVIGDSNSAFGSIAGAVIPFIQVLQDLLRSQKIDLPQVAKKFLDTANPKS
ncbi:SPFH domain-containing protein [Candidatus Borrarchaeum sp.]|uniref:SPFH domain-containing protein n=1 Tax=Candidatus Borrarchaeum sp. TaxID=2846742 RepID=UPI00257BF94A|nr:SPFH domain-containing protein [Candidatus Borrarchaeum sp.]